MEIRYFKEYSYHLNRDMEYKVYGWGGKPCLVFPSQDSRFYDYENWGMPYVIEDMINDGKVQLFCCDGLDWESWTAKGDPRHRIEQQERWVRYIIEELVPRIYQIGGSQEKLMATGCSMGAFHAANFFFRFPDKFDTVVALSGCYNANYFFGDYCDDLVYANSPEQFLAGMPNDHPYIQMYNQSRIILCTGQGAWEWELLPSIHRMDDILRAKGIHAWVDYWGFDVAHDWPWWKVQLRYFMEKLF